MRIQFIYTNRNKFPFPIAPIGILTLAAIVENQGHTVKVTDLMFSQNPKMDIERDIIHFKPQLIAISFRNYNNHDPLNFESYIDELNDYVDSIRKLTNAIIIIGGPGFTRLPTEIFQQVEVDFGLAGESEESFPQFVEKLEQGDSVNDIAGIVMRIGGEVHSKPCNYIYDLNKYPFQNVGLIDYQKYIDNGGYVGIETKRGCPNSCIYCDDSLIAGKAVRLKNPLRVIQEMKYIIENYGFRDFYFADSLFSLPTNHFEEICREIINSGLKIRFEIEATPQGINLENAFLLKKAGCIGVFLTIDTASPKILKTLKKSFTQQDIMNACKAFSSAKLPYALCVNVGGHGETLETYHETISFLKTLPASSAIFFGLGFKIEKNTELDRIAIQEKIIEKNVDYIRGGIYFAEGFEPGFSKIINEECLKNPGWVKLNLMDTGMTKESVDVLSFSKGRKKIKPAWLRTKELAMIKDILSG